MFISITPGTNQSRKKRISCSGSIFVTFTYMHLTVKVITLKELIKHRHCWKVSARKRVQKHIRCVDILQNIKKRPQQVEKIQQTNSDIIKNWGSTPQKQRKSGENKKDQVTENHAGKNGLLWPGLNFFTIIPKGFFGPKTNRQTSKSLKERPH